MQILGLLTGKGGVTLKVLDTLFFSILPEDFLILNVIQFLDADMG
jgi:hypothetical protein